ncbi:MAG: PAS domain S-box protein [Acetobacteraceae bacterium]|nr:PAS domain S-box protein [Acetobacteraceae bacterium]
MRGHLLALVAWVFVPAFLLGGASGIAALGPRLESVPASVTAAGILASALGLASAVLSANRVVLALRQLTADMPPRRSGIREIDDIADLLGRAAQERARAPAELRESEARFRATFEQAAVGIAHVGLDGSWLRVNTRLCEKLGHTREELLAKTSQDITHPDDLDADLACVRQMLAGEIASYAMEKRYFRGDGSILWANLTVALVRDADGAAQYFVLVVEDISRRRRAEDAARDSEARLHDLVGTLEMRVREEVAAREAAQARAAHAERVQALGQLAGGIAHDFNNVLQTVQSGAALIERRADEAETVRHLARVVLDGAERGASVTRRLLAFARRDASRASAVEAGEALDGLREILGHALGPTITLRVDLERGLPPLLADKGQLETALVNLATNARDAMPQGGTLTFAACQEVLSAEATPAATRLGPGRYVRLSVIDSGTGMDRATLERVCEPFFTTKAPGQGTGLGLAMVKDFAEQSGGALAVESAPGRGTIVTLWLPQATAQPSEAKAACADPDARADSRVLLLDDDPLVRETLALQLKAGGHAVLAVASGAEALALLAAGERADILVTDLAMPDMDGLAVIRAAQRRRPGLPAVLLTGYAGDGASLAVSGAVSGAFSLLRKPVSSSQLLDRIAALLAARAETPVSERPTRQ